MVDIKAGTDVAPRSGAQTRAAIQQIASDLFTAQGYEATSMREIAEALGIRKASLYYHFASKEAIVRSIVDERETEAQDLLEWIAEQPQSIALVKAAVLRWVDSSSLDKIRGIKFLSTNPLLMTKLAGNTDSRIRSALTAVLDAITALVPSATPADVLQLRMALLSINHAVDSASNASFSDDEIVATALAAAAALVDDLVERSSLRRDR